MAVQEIFSALSSFPSKQEVVVFDQVGHKVAFETHYLNQMSKK